MPGPVPKRSDQRRRRNAPDGPPLVKAKSTDKVTIPRADPDWHPVAKRWYDSLKKSGQSQFYENSDWATAYYVAEAMSRNLYQGRFSGQLFQSVMSAMTDLLTTEGARRRARIELERLTSGEDEEQQATLAILADYRRAAGEDG